jgi:ankyrin repeat protein
MRIRKLMTVAAVLILSTAATRAADSSTTAPTAEQVFQAIRSNQLDELKRLTAAGGAKTKDKLLTTPLHYAALYGNAESVRILLDGGADVNALDSREATPLIYAAYNFEKTRLLVERGASVKVVARNKMTPLDIAVGLHGNTPTVRYLLDRGADVRPPEGADSTALITAAERADPDVVKLLLHHGADPKSLDSFGETALLWAALGDPGKICAEKMDLLLPGSDVNVLNTFAGTVKNGPIALTHMNALMWAVQSCGPAATAKLLKAGANVNEHDVRNMTPLMMALSLDDADPDTVKLLLKAGADVKAKDLNGETAMDWALKYGNPAIIRLLEAAGAPHGELKDGPKRPATYNPAVADALKSSADLLAKATVQFWPAGGGCVACHAQPPTARAYVAMHDAGLNPPESMKRIFSDGFIANRPRMLSTAPFLLSLGGDYDGPLTEFDALADMNAAPNDTTDAMLHYLAVRQQPTGEWAHGGNGRPPINGNSISRTASAIRALKMYGWPARQAEFDQRITLARHWLVEAKADTIYEKADRLIGLYYAGAAEPELRAAAKDLMKAQRYGGGWPQTPYLPSDAYATGLSLYALRTAKQIQVSDPIYKAGVAYLLNTQMPDGSWYVRSRAMKLQPYFQSGFPYDHDQWISSAATAWAVTAIAPAASPVTAGLHWPRVGSGSQH